MIGLHSIPTPPRPVRAVLHVMWPLVGVAATAALTPVIIAGAFHSLVDRRARVFRVSMLAVLLLWTDIRMLLGCWRIGWREPAGLGADPADPSDSSDHEEWIAQHERLFLDTLDQVMHLSKRWVGFEVRLTGRMDFGADDAPLIALARHAGPGDSIALAWMLGHTVERLPRIVLSSALRWDASIDTMLTRLHADFVPSGSGAGDDRLRGVQQLAQSLTKRDVMLIFPEGENWSPTRHARGVERLRQRGNVVRAWWATRLHHVLAPRSRGVVAALTARPDADVMVLAHAGFGELHSPKAIWEALPFTGRPFLVKSWTYAADDLPHSEADIEAWLDERWLDVDGWIAQVKAAWLASLRRAPH